MLPHSDRTENRKLIHCSLPIRSGDAGGYLQSQPDPSAQKAADSAHAICQKAISRFFDRFPQCQEVAEKMPDQNFGENLNLHKVGSDSELSRGCLQPSAIFCGKEEQRCECALFFDKIGASDTQLAPTWWCNTNQKQKSFILSADSPWHGAGIGVHASKKRPAE